MKAVYSKLFTNERNMKKHVMVAKKVMDLDALDIVSIHERKSVCSTSWSCNSMIFHAVDELQVSTIL